MSTADPQEERAVLDAFRQAIEHYCTMVTAGVLDPGSLRISVSVLTRAPMSRGFAGKVHRIVNRHVDARLPRARVVSVTFAVDPFVPEPGHQFLLQPPALPAPKQTLPLSRPIPPPPKQTLLLPQPGPASSWPNPPQHTPQPTRPDPHQTQHDPQPTRPHQTQHDPQPAQPHPQHNPQPTRSNPRRPIALPATRLDPQLIVPNATRPDLDLPPTAPPTTARPTTAHLTLQYGADFRWVCHLASAPGWVPLGRWTGQAIRDASVRLPEYATFLPRGELLYLRHDGHRVEFARSRVRPDYLITIDGAPLRADGRLIQAGPAGSIGYTDGTTSSTLLDYHLAWEGGHG